MENKEKDKSAIEVLKQKLDFNLLEGVFDDLKESRPVLIDSILAAMEAYAIQKENQREDNGSGYKRALEEIVSPIKFMQNRLQEGERLNGEYAIMLAKDANYLQSIAKKALEEPPSYNEPVGEEGK